jgi:hypothetical protein
MSERSPEWLTSTNPTTFFFEKVTSAQQKQGTKLTENVEFYLVHLLSDLVFGGMGTMGSSHCLFDLLKKATESERNGKVAFYKQLGDTALTFSGLFYDYFNNKSFDISYYKSMGENAFDHLVSLMNRKNSFEQTMSLLYAELRDDFNTAVDILMDVSDQTNLSKPNKSTLEVYERWMTTQSKRLESELISKDIIPLPFDNKKIC